MKHVRRLMSPSIDGHSRAEVVVARLEELDAELRDQRVLAVLLDELEREGIAPDGHGREPTRA